MEDRKTAFESLAEVSAELDKLDAELGEKMNGFDENKPAKEFWPLMSECNALIEHMAGLYKLEAYLKKSA